MSLHVSLMLSPAFFLMSGWRVTIITLKIYLASKPVAAHLLVCAPLLQSKTHNLRGLCCAPKGI